MTDSRNGQVVTFYSYKGGTGRTMALANVAWILAANGKRVLVVDWDLESPGLYRFFKPFIGETALSSTGGVINLIREYEWASTREKPTDSGWIQRYASVEKHSFSLEWDLFPGEGTLDYLSAGQQHTDYATAIASMNWDDFYENLQGGQFFDALRADMKRDYDYTLIDSRTGLSDVADICTIHLPDILVDCFTLSEQGIDGAGDVARRVTESADRRIRILPVQMRIDYAEKRKAEIGRSTAIERFAGLPAGLTETDHTEYWLRMQVPYQAYYAYEETLATFGDQPGASGSLLEAYELLTAHITQNEITSLPSLDEPLRTSMVTKFERKTSRAEDSVVLRYAPEDEVWAEWIEFVLAWAGVRVYGPSNVHATQPVSARSLMIVSAANAEEVATLSLDGDRTRSPLAIYISDITPLKNIPIATSAFIAGLSAGHAVERVLPLVGRSATEMVQQLPEGGPRFPGDTPEVFNVQARNNRFTGREAELRMLRRDLRTGSAVVLSALQGMGGIGKTQLAVEYAHRFRAAYDIVWWINSDPVGDIESSLADLGTRLSVSSESPGPENTRAVQQALSRGRRRWLLIFDNAEDPATIEPFLPTGNGHVLITSRNPQWSDRAHTLQVDVFQRRESVEHLGKRVPTMRPDEANQIAELLQDLPIAVAAAGAWLADTGRPVEEYLRLMASERPIGALEASPNWSIQRTWDLSLDRLKDQSPAAYRLFELCSVLAPQIATDLIYHQHLAQVLEPLDGRLSEPIFLATLVQQINKLALLRLDQRGEGTEERDRGQGGQVLVHRLVQAVVRSRMSPAELDEARREVHQLLAAVRPKKEVDIPETWTQYRMIWPHLDVAGAVSSTDETVRQLTIDRVRYQWLHGDLAAGRARGEDAVQVWTEQLAHLADPAERLVLHRQILHLKFNLANILGEMGLFSQSRPMDEEVLQEQRTLLGPTHPHTLMTAGGLARDLRGLGRYREALERDKQTYAAWLELFGDEHPRTLAALNNVATCNRLMGDFRVARERDESVLERRKRVLGDRNPFTIASAANVARDIRDAGDYARSVTIMRGVYRDCMETRGADSRAALTAQSNLAVSLRSAGDVEGALKLHEDAYERLTDRLGQTNPDTLGCRLSLALTHLANGDFHQANKELLEVGRIYANSLGERHPHTLVCLNNRAIAARALGEQTRSAEMARQAADLAREAVDGLSEVLGPNHPYTLSGQMNQAICEVDVGNLPGAMKLLRRARELMPTVLGPDHPNTLRCEVNAVLVAQAMGQPGSEEVLGDLSRRLIARVGESHPIVDGLRRRRYLYRIIDPHPF
jgi:cellulose biosynthesis protein BcsQ/tetratricopeptide (TPR) repeat protein